jgi:hypothetical protein
MLIRQKYLVEFPGVIKSRRILAQRVSKVHLIFFLIRLALRDELLEIIESDEAILEV